MIDSLAARMMLVLEFGALKGNDVYMNYTVILGKNNERSELVSIGSLDSLFAFCGANLVVI